MGVLRHVRGILPGLKGPEAKGKVKRGRMCREGAELRAGLQEAGLGVEGGLGLSHGEGHWFLGELETNRV